MRGCEVVVALLAGCAFERPRVPDGGTDDSPDPVTCEGFTQVGSSHYLPQFQRLVTWEEAVKLCEAFPGSHLVTFETLDEITEVAQGIEIQLSVWTGVVQLATAATPTEGWVNELELSQTPVPSSFPWDIGAPNDYDLTEDSQENYAQLRPEGTFGDQGRGELARALCECTVSP